MKDDAKDLKHLKKQPTVQDELKELFRAHSKKKHVRTTMKVLDKAMHSEGNKVVKLVQDWESFSG